MAANIYVIAAQQKVADVCSELLNHGFATHQMMQPGNAPEILNAIQEDITHRQSQHQLPPAQITTDNNQRFTHAANPDEHAPQNHQQGYVTQLQNYGQQISAANQQQPPPPQLNQYDHLHHPMQLNTYQPHQQWSYEEWGEQRANGNANWEAVIASHQGPNQPTNAPNVDPYINVSNNQQQLPPYQPTHDPNVDPYINVPNNQQHLPPFQPANLQEENVFFDPFAMSPEIPINASRNQQLPPPAAQTIANPLAQAQNPHTAPATASMNLPLQNFIPFHNRMEILPDAQQEILKRTIFPLYYCDNAKLDLFLVGQTGVFQLKFGLVRDPPLSQYYSKKPKKEVATDGHVENTAATTSNIPPRQDAQLDEQAPCSNKTSRIPKKRNRLNDGPKNQKRTKAKPSGFYDESQTNLTAL